MAIGCIGDIHGNIKRLQALHDEAIQNPDITALIQVGDFGFYQSKLELLQQLQLEIPVYWIDGNHENYPLLAQFLTDDSMVSDGVYRITENLFYVSRGTVLSIDGRTIAFCGGAASVDKKHRLLSGMSWHEEENITIPQVERMMQNVIGKKIDIFVTHTPPQSTIKKCSNPDHLVRYFGLHRGWTDPSAFKIQEMWDVMGNPKLICGHMHMAYVDGPVRILNIDELLVV